MDSINEQFNEIYNSTYKIEQYTAKKTNLTKNELFTFSLKQHRFLKSFHTTNTTKNILCILVREITEEVLERYYKVTKLLTIPVFIITDTYSSKYTTYKHLTIIYMFENFCYENGYFYINTDTMPHRLVIAWDRCMFFLSQYQELFEYAWVMEDDIAIGGPLALPNMFYKNSGSKADLLALEPIHNIPYKDDRSGWPLWKSMRDSGFTDLVGTFNPLTRFSNRFIQELDKFVKKKNRLFYLEIFFPTLCKATGLTIEYFEGYKEIQNTFRYSPNITLEETIQKKEDLKKKNIEYPIFHPVKDTVLWEKIWENYS